MKRESEKGTWLSTIQIQFVPPKKMAKIDTEMRRLSRQPSIKFPIKKGTNNERFAKVSPSLSCFFLVSPFLIMFSINYAATHFRGKVFWAFFVNFHFVFTRLFNYR